MSSDRSRLVEAKEEPPLSGIEILLVEDNAFNQIVVKGMLESMGAFVTVVENGQLAVDQIRLHVGAFDIVLMDIQMPVMDGFEATRIVRQELSLGMPILAMTAAAMESDKEKCFTVGMNGFIPKPVDIKQLLNAISDHISIAGNASPPVPSPSGGAPIEGVFEPHILLQHCEGNAQRIRNLQNSILEMAGETCTELERASLLWQLGQNSQAAAIIHGLRGSLGNVGAKRFVAISLELEQAIVSNRAARIAGLFESAKIEVEATAGAIRDWYASLPKASFDPDISSTYTFDEEILDKWRQLLKGRNIRAYDMYAEIRSALHQRLTEEEGATLDSAMARLKFANALEIVAKVSR